MEKNKVMEATKPLYEKYLFVCENQRAEGDCCGLPAQKIRVLLKQHIETKGLAEKVRVSRTGCLDACSEGPNVLLMPDNVWFKRVSEGDVEKIVAYVA